MDEVRGGVPTWQDELASLVDAGIRYEGAEIGLSHGESELRSFDFESGSESAESFKDQVAGFLKSWGEMVLDLGMGCKDILQQTLINEDSFVVRKLGKPAAKVSKKLSFLNEFLPEDRDPIHAWPVIFFVFLLSLAALSFNSEHSSLIPPVKIIRVHPPTASRIQLPDGRYLAYQERGVSADRARYSIIAPHSFLSSRLAGIPGIKSSLLEDFGSHLVTYDLPGFGESDPHPGRNLNSSAFDMLYLADAIGINGKFWVLGYSSGSMHSWAALKHIPERIAGAVMIAPLINPYEPTMTKEEMSRTWQDWLARRRLMYSLARMLPNLLPFFYRRTFLSGKLGQLEKWMSVSLGMKDKLLVESQVFEEFWHRDVEESVRQGSAKSFIQEAVLQVSNWGFSLAELHVQKKCKAKSVLTWLMSMYSEADCELTGFQGPIHIWQGMDDRIVPPSMADHINRVIPEAIMHKIPNEGHFSYNFFCDECHRQILSSLFGSPQGPLDETEATAGHQPQPKAENAELKAAEEIKH